MNKILKELYNEVVGSDKLSFDSYLAERFAELIIKECIDLVEYNSHGAAKDIKEHFGVTA